MKRTLSTVFVWECNVLSQQSGEGVAKWKAKNGDWVQDFFSEALCPKWRVME
ncbi:hypothetical protein [Maribacter polysaccharolyticus]|uniref:hypothetical protein n=1 Tax=Maribacter polysaccharolyticus TaxID=3020831 RepID=UPI00237EFB62|nr:hypothetical protein [Maribacter polysaccharolyticus]MDE3741111.1 hypothetical protein [Maribacter polysaccharolyticus]